MGARRAPRQKSTSVYITGQAERMSSPDSPRWSSAAGRGADRPLQLLVYARHDPELMGCKSPVGGPPPDDSGANSKPKARATPRGVVVKEAGGKPASRRTETPSKADHPGASQHNMTKPCGPGDTVNGAVVQGRFWVLCGEICPGCSPGPRERAYAPCRKAWETPQSLPPPGRRAGRQRPASRSRSQQRS